MLYGLIGEKLGHSYSQQIHANIADYEYELKELAADELDGFFAERSFQAINVTIPYKKTVIAYLDGLSPRAESIGAVNTIVKRDGKLYGYNTDYAGMAALAAHAHIDMSGKKVLILGSGGTAATAVAVSQGLGARQIHKVSRSGKSGCISYEAAKEKHFDAELIINATPVGMYPKCGAQAIELACFEKLEAVLDAVYNPLRTELVLDAQRRKIKAEGGLYMLSAQAVYASALFLDKKARESEIEKAYRQVYNEASNIVLIGMPGSGKSSVGKKLAKKTGKDFVDTDELIIETIKMPIAEFFAKKGEAAFRDVESEIIEKLSQTGGKVIATGGGAVLREANVNMLKRNGRTFFLDRAPQLLIPTSDRPLALNRDAIMSRYAERYDIYTACADIRIDGNESVEKTAQKLLEVIGQ